MDQGFWSSRRFAYKDFWFAYLGRPSRSFPWHPPQPFCGRRRRFLLELPSVTITWRIIVSVPTSACAKVGRGVTWILFVRSRQGFITDFLSARCAVEKEAQPCIELISLVVLGAWANHKLLEPKSTDLFLQLSSKSAEAVLTLFSCFISIVRVEIVAFPVYKAFFVSECGTVEWP